YRKAPLTAPLWPVGDGLWAGVTVVMLIASILLMGSFIRNPAFPTGGRPGSFPDAARGVYAVTRHPMMWSFALWGLCHAAVFP
ncbi:NnrU family protein, partial [Cupriavidus sp. SIMBA_020]|uniref:NnrU family protein n=1 Tax=Cupriavidus sp. SIMBA_020 TaxID=3085766 RepID=UPI00397AC652